MAQILTQKAGKLSIGDAFLIALTKTFTERFLSNYVGNASFFSGGVKLVSAVLLNQYLSGKTGDIVSTALVVDGTEDIINNLLASGLPAVSGGGSAGAVVI